MIPSPTQNWPTSGGLYRVRLSPTHYYIGRAANFRARWQRHLNQLRSGAHPNQYLLNVYLQHQRFDPEVLIEEADDGTRQTLEQQWLDQHVGSPGCLNLSRSSLGVPKGYKHPEGAKTRIRGRVPTDEARRNMSEAGKKRVWTEETKARISASLTGQKRPWTSERNKATAGWVHTEEARERIRAANKARTYQPHSAEARQKISDTMKARGLTPSAETLQKRSVSLKAAWARRKLAGET